MQARVATRTDFQFSTEQFGNTVVIRLKPRYLDASFSERDRRAVGHLMAKYAKVVLDFAEVADADRNGLRMIAEWVNSMQSAGSALVLARCSGPILALLGILRISRFVPMVSDWRAALVCLENGQNMIGHATGLEPRRLKGTHKFTEQCQYEEPIL